MAVPFLPQARPTIPGNADLTNPLLRLGDTVAEGITRVTERNQLRDLGEAAQGGLDALREEAFRQGRIGVGLQAQKMLEARRNAEVRARGQGGVFGTPIYGEDEQGNTVLGVIGKDGTFRQVDTGGMTPTPGVKFQDFGTFRQGFDRRTGQPATPRLQVDVAGEAAQKEEGKLRGEARADLSNAISKAEKTVALIERLELHPGRETATGLSGTLDPRNYIPGTDARNFQALLEQLEGKAFLEAFESLKGGGHITEIEGVKGTRAIIAMQRAQSDEQFLENLLDFKDIVRRGINRAKQRAGLTTPDSDKDQTRLEEGVIDFSALPE